MNKFAKGSLAAGAGLVLLLGGAGTLAYWNDSAELTGGTINAGTLTLEADQELLDASIAAQPGMWVPGDEHTFSTELTLTTEGDSIAGEIGLDIGTLEASSPAVEYFAFEMDMGTVEMTNADGSISFDETTDVITFAGPGTYTIPVDVTVAFTETNALQNDAKDLRVDFSDLTFTATQTAVDTSTE